MEQMISTDNTDIAELLDNIILETQRTVISEDMLHLISALSGGSTIEVWHYDTGLPDAVVGYSRYESGEVTDRWESDAYSDETSILTIREHFDGGFCVCPSCGFDFLYGTDHDCD